MYFVINCVFMLRPYTLVVTLHILACNYLFLVGAYTLVGSICNNVVHFSLKICFLGCDLHFS